MFRTVHNGCTVPHEVLSSSPETSISEWLKVWTPTDTYSARKDQSDHSAGMMDSLNSVITHSAKCGLSYGVRFPKEMPKPSPPLAKLYNFSPSRRALSESSSVSWIRSSSARSVTQAWAPPAQRCLHLLISQGKTTHGFPVAAGSAPVSDVCWALFVCLERDAEEGHCAPLEVGSFASVFKQDSGIGIDLLFLLLFHSLFSVFFAVTQQQML